MQTFNDLLLHAGSASNTSMKSFLNRFMPTIQNDNIQVRLDIVLKVENFLSKNTNHPLENFFDHGIIPFLIDCLKNPNDILQCHSILMLSKFTDHEESNNCQTIIDCGALTVLFELISPDAQLLQIYLNSLLKDLLKWKPLTADECYIFGLYDILDSIISPSTSLHEWCRISAIMSLIELDSKLQRFVELFLSSLHKHLPKCAAETSDKALNEICTILHNFCVKRKELCKMVVKSRIFEKIIPVLSFSEKWFMLQILDILDSVIEYQEFNDVIISYGYLHIIEELLFLNSSDADVIKKACDFILNLGKNPDSVQAIIDSNLIYTLVDMSAWITLKEKIADTLQRLLYYANEIQALQIIKMNVIPVLSTFLDGSTNNKNLIERILETFLTVLEKCTDNVKAICDEMKEYCVAEKVIALQSHKNKNIRDAANKIVDTYFYQKESGYGK